MRVYTHTQLLPRNKYGFYIIGIELSERITENSVTFSQTRNVHKQ